MERRERGSSWVLVRRRRETNIHSRKGIYAPINQARENVGMPFPQKPNEHISVNVEFGEEEGHVSLKEIEKRAKE